MSKNGSLNNHLAYANDIVGNNSIKLVMQKIQKYEESSGQMVNREKSFFLTAPKIAAARINRMRTCTCFIYKNTIKS